MALLPRMESKAPLKKRHPTPNSTSVASTNCRRASCRSIKAALCGAASIKIIDIRNGSVSTAEKTKFAISILNARFLYFDSSSITLYPAFFTALAIFFISVLFSS